MRGTKAKALRREARAQTVGQTMRSYNDFDFRGCMVSNIPTCRLSQFCTRKVYQELKRARLAAA